MVSRDLALHWTIRLLSSAALVLFLYALLRLDFPAFTGPTTATVTGGASGDGERGASAPRCESSEGGAPVLDSTPFPSAVAPGG